MLCDRRQGRFPPPHLVSSNAARATARRAGELAGLLVGRVVYDAAPDLPLTFLVTVTGTVTVILIFFGFGLGLGFGPRGADAWLSFA